MRDVATKLLYFIRYNLTLALQIAFYTLALAGYLWQKKAKHPRLVSIPFSFCLVNLAALVGVARPGFEPFHFAQDKLRRKVPDREKGGTVGAGEKLK